MRNISNLHKGTKMLRRRFLLLLFVLNAIVSDSLGQPDQISVEILTVILENGTIYNGSGTDSVITDIGLLGDRIVAMGDLHDRRAGLRLDVQGLAVVPGFIDIHSHATRGIYRWPDAENYIRQGVTTVIGGPDGGSPYPIGEYLSHLEATPPAVNFGTFVGHGTIRRKVLGNEDRPPTSDEMITMKEMVASAMQEGAFGLSSGLKYVPGAYATTEEVIELSRVAGLFGGIYISHMREEGLDLLKSVAETIRIGEEGKLPTQLTHHKVVGADMWGKSRQTLAMVDAARARGVDVSIDQYPYTASSTSLSILFPAWSLEGEKEDVLARLKDPDTRARIRKEVLFNLIHDRGGNNPANVVVARCTWDPSLNGKSLADILHDRGQPVSVDTAADLALDLQERGGFSGIFHAMHEEDVRRIMQHSFTMIASDGGIYAPGAGVPHPRNYGTFARVLGHYVRAQGLLSFNEAIRKMTRLPADRINLTERGRIDVGSKADLAVIDPGAIRDLATFAEPHQYAEGARHVFVNGVAVLLNGEMTGNRPGRILRSTGR
jgi:dihydroorotase/N-acyl-D-amino-acid deacylase